MPKPRRNDIIQCTHFRWLLYQRDGTWYADGRSNPQKLGRHSLETSKRDEALTTLKELDLYKAVEHGLASKAVLDRTETANFSLAQGWEWYLASVEGRRALEGLSVETRKRYCPVRDKFQVFCQAHGITQIHQLTKRVVIAYGVWLDGEGYAYATKCLEITTIKQLMKYLIDEGHLPSSAHIKISMRKPNDSDRYCWRPAEVAAICARCQQSKSTRWLYPVMVSLASTGMRISELASLRWSDIDFDNNMIRLTDERHSTARRKKGDARELKGKQGRSFPIHDSLLPVLKTMTRAKDGKVFHGPRGGQLKADTVRTRLIRDVLTPLKDRFPPADGAATSFIDGRLHSFRHYFCSICANSGVPEPTLMKWLGHRSSKMIRRYYHLHDEASQQAMKKVVAIPPQTPPEKSA